MSIKQKINGKVSLVPIYSTEVGMVDPNNNFQKKNVEGALQELKSESIIYNYKNITTLNNAIKRGQYSVQDGDDTFPWRFGTLLILEKEKEKTAIFQATGGVAETFVAYLIDGKDSWSEWKQLATVNDTVQKKIEVTGANLDTLISNGIYRCFEAKIGFPLGYTTNNDFFLINYNINSPTTPWLRQTLYDIRSSKIFTRQIHQGVIEPWKELSISEKFEVSTQNQWYAAWTTNTTNVVACEKNGFTTHVSTFLVAGVSTTDTVIMQLPNIAKDHWYFFLCEDGSMGKFYLGWDGKLYAKYDIKQGKNYLIDFSYRSN